jgi:flagellar FliJ protein
MSKPFALQAVLDLMQRRADDATQQLARLIAAEQDASTKLTLLTDYRAEYARRFQSSAQEGLTPQQWRNFQDFLGRLDDAIDQQREVVTRSRQNTATGQQEWQRQQVKLKAMDTLSDRHQQSETRRELHQEQKLIDEIAARGRKTREDPS